MPDAQLQSRDALLEEKMQIETVWFDRLDVVGYPGKGPGDEPRMFEHLAEGRDKIANRSDDNTYLVMNTGPLTAAVAVSEVGAIPEGFVHLTIGAGEYVRFRFEEQYVGRFWDFWCGNRSAQVKYNVDHGKQKFEIFNEELKKAGLVEYYVSTLR